MTQKATAEIRNLTPLKAGIGKAKQENEPMTHGIGRLWAI